MTNERVHSHWGIAVSTAAITAGLCLIDACVSIYLSGSSPFSRESVAAAFSAIDIPVYICLVLVLGGFILDIFFPREKTKLTADKQYETILTNLCQKLDLNQCQPELAQKIKKQRTGRKVFRIVQTILIVLCCSAFFVIGAAALVGYIIVYQAFPEDANMFVVTAMPLFFGCFAISFLVSVIAAYHKTNSMRKEIELVKQAIANGAATDTPKPVPKAKKETVTAIFRYAILGIAVIVLIGGFIFGGTADVLAKAAAICTECVGLG